MAVAMHGQGVSDTIRKPKSKITAPIHYTANDSIVLTGDGVAMLHGNGKVTYEKMELTSAYIRVKMDSNLVYAADQSGFVP